jgi:hypothetical protein
LIFNGEEVFDAVDNQSRELPVPRQPPWPTLCINKKLPDLIVVWYHWGLPADGHGIDS